MSNRFFVSTESVSADAVSFTREQRRQMRTVLRIRLGDHVCALDGTGREYVVRLREMNEIGATGEILEIRTPETESKIRMTLIQGMPKGEKLDMILQKCTELGTAEFVIAETTRSVPRLPEDRLPGRLRRWNAIVREAAEQSGRTLLPMVDGIVSFEYALAKAKACDVGIIGWENEREKDLMSVLPRLKGARTAAYMVGPEGGFTEAEISAARTAGLISVSLGPRVLRTETAAIVGTALIVLGAGKHTLPGGNHA